VYQCIYMLGSRAKSSFVFFSLFFSFFFGVEGELGKRGEGRVLDLIHQMRIPRDAVNRFNTRLSSCGRFVRVSLVREINVCVEQNFDFCLITITM